jgi:hypothetical protein
MTFEEADGSKYGVRVQALGWQYDRLRPVGRPDFARTTATHLALAKWPKNLVVIADI